eukprot:TRINITY_DN69141_c0_g1_i1.p2 TRINITY_DN69141_c0_g1~~TRINITY_DN69141_c0_g1_i1.p2  ORF type:complete len:367 (-),score=71.44 TRINITY_DN69141_c0_g1_i1:165-1265(-)
MMPVSETHEAVPRRSIHRAVIAVVGTLALVAGAVIAITGLSSAGPVRGEFTARMLLDDPKVHAVAADNVMKIGQQMFGPEVSEDGLREKVTGHFSTIMKLIDEKMPELSAALQAVPLTPEQTEAVLHVMTFNSDLRMQRLGLAVSRCLRQVDSDAPAVLKEHLLKCLKPNFAELKSLAAEVFPPAQRVVFVGKGHGFDELFKPDRLTLLRSFSDDWDARLSSEPRRLEVVTRAPSQEEQMKLSAQVIGSVGVASEEVMAILRIIQPICEIFGKDLDIPATVTSVLGLLNFALQVTSCVLHNLSERQNAKAMACPMMSASAAFDAMRQVFTLMGLLDDGNSTNGITGNWNGGPTTYGIFERNQGILN